MMKRYPKPVALAYLVAWLAGLGVAPSAPPPWWDNTDDSLDALDGSGATVDQNYAPANIGQAKWMATLAHAAMEAKLPGGAGFALSDLFPEPPPSPPASYYAEQYSTLNLGQLKFMAKPFYDRLEALRYDNRAAIESEVMAYLPGWSHPYPWDPATPIAENYKPANLGQLKMVFSFDVDAVPGADPSGEGYEPVVWTDLVGTAASYPGGAGSTLRRTATGTGWVADGISLGILPGDGTLRFRVTSPAFEGIFVGLSQRNLNSYYSTVESAIYFNLAGRVNFYKLGQLQFGSYGSYAPANLFEISREGQDIKFRRDGNLIKTITLSHSSPLIVDTSFHNQHGEISECESIGFYAATLDSDNDGLSDWWEINHGLDPDSYADGSGDSDGDGFTEYEEFLGGTDPNSNSSTPPAGSVPFVIHRPGFNG